MNITINNKFSVLGHGFDWLMFNRRMFTASVPCNLGYNDVSKEVNLNGKAFHDLGAIMKAFANAESHPVKGKNIRKFTH